MAKHFSSAAVVVFLMMSAASVGCGGDDDGDKSPADSGMPVGDGGGGTGGMSGGGGGGSGGAGGTVAVAQPVECGSIMCQPPMNPLAGLIGMFAGALGGGAGMLPTPQACCLDETAETCGVSMTVGGMCEELATPDPRCPRLMFPMLGPIDIGTLLGPNAGAGCCIDDQCGLDGTLFGRGCVELSEAATMLGGGGGGAGGASGGLGMLGGNLMFPEPRACDAPPDDDAGTTDDDAGL